MSAGVAVAIAIAMATVVSLGVILWLWQKPPRPAAAHGTAAAVAASETPATAPMPPAPAGSLRGQHQLAESALWRYAFGVRGELPPVPPEHQPVVNATVAALQAGNLADRYFPRRPMLMPQLQAAVNDPDAPPTRLAGIIAQDPVLAGNVLKLANSVFYRINAEPVESIQRAIIVCGTDGLQSLAATALVQPVFRGGAEAHMRFPAILWERCTRASAAAEICARRWCPADRQTAQLLALMAALGPLVVYRVVQDQYRAQSALQPSPAVFLALIAAHGNAMAHRVAQMWQSSPRILETLSQSVATGDADAAIVRLSDSLLAGELLATLSVLLDQKQIDAEQCVTDARSAGIDRPLFDEVWARLHRNG